MKYIKLLLFCWYIAITQGQTTIGLTTYDPKSTEGYTLISPVGSHTTYLIDNCGRLINSWTSDRNPGQSAYLMPNGLLYRTGKVQGSFFAGGVGGNVQIFNWNGEIIWDFTYVSDSFHLHHDIEPLENGNILMISWYRMSEEEAIENGRNPDFINERGLWTEKIIEVRPVGLDSSEIVWEWNCADHLIQDLDSTKRNFGSINDHPERININFGREETSDLAISDWLHLNSIDYYPELDQILLSSRKFNEIWIIDHSTTAEEAKSSFGGRAKKGGDLLYRWGNARSYGRGESDDQVLFGQHYAQWIQPGRSFEGDIIVYNNGFERSPEAYSSIEILSPPLAIDGQYAIDNGKPFGPLTAHTTYDGREAPMFASERMSSAQQLPNGNFQGCDGGSGRIFEFTPEGDLVWEYINPIFGMLPASQGTAPMQNQLFHAPFYLPDFEAFQGQELIPGPPLEIDPGPPLCPSTNTLVPEIQKDWYWLQNLDTNQIQFMNLTSRILELDIYSLSGHHIFRRACSPGVCVFQLSKPAGVYFLRVINNNHYSDIETVILH